jgi:hypothetical protein
MYLDDFECRDIGEVQTKGQLLINGHMVKVHRRPLLHGGYLCYFIDETGHRRRKVYQAGNCWVTWQWLVDRGYEYKCRSLSNARRKKLAAEKLEKRQGGNFRWLFHRPHKMNPQRWENLRRKFCELAEIDLPEPYLRKIGLPRGDHDLPRDWLGRWVRKEVHEEA